MIAPPLAAGSLGWRLTEQQLHAAAELLGIGGLPGLRDFSGFDAPPEHLLLAGVRSLVAHGLATTASEAKPAQVEEQLAEALLALTGDDLARAAWLARPSGTGTSLVLRGHRAVHLTQIDEGNVLLVHEGSGVAVDRLQIELDGALAPGEAAAQAPPCTGELAARRWDALVAGRPALAHDPAVVVRAARAVAARGSWEALAAQCHAGGGFRGELISWTVDAGVPLSFERHAEGEPEDEGRVVVEQGPEVTARIRGLCSHWLR